MRCCIGLMVVAGLAMPLTAQAGEPVTGPGFKASIENGITVYRGQPSEENAHYVQHLHNQYLERRQKAALKVRLFEQQRQIAAQAAALAALQQRVTLAEQRAQTQQQPRRRARYGRSYYGNPRFFGSNGFRGNSNFSGGSVQTNIVVHPRRRRR